MLFQQSVFVSSLLLTTLAGPVFRLPEILESDRATEARRQEADERAVEQHLAQAQQCSKDSCAHLANAHLLDHRAQSLQQKIDDNLAAHGPSGSEYRDPSMNKELASLKQAKDFAARKAEDSEQHAVDSDLLANRHKGAAERIQSSLAQRKAIQDSKADAPKFMDKMKSHYTDITAGAKQKLRIGPSRNKDGHVPFDQQLTPPTSVNSAHHVFNRQLSPLAQDIGTGGGMGGRRPAAEPLAHGDYAAAASKQPIVDVASTQPRLSELSASPTRSPLRDSTEKKLGLSKDYRPMSLSPEHRAEPQTSASHGAVDEPAQSRMQERRTLSPVKTKVEASPSPGTPPRPSPWSRQFVEPGQTSPPSRDVQFSRQQSGKSGRDGRDGTQRSGSQNSKLSEKNVASVERESGGQAKGEKAHLDGWIREARANSGSVEHGPIDPEHVQHEDPLPKGAVKERPAPPLKEWRVRDGPYGGSEQSGSHALSKGRDNSGHGTGQGQNPARRGTEFPARAPIPQGQAPPPARSSPPLPEATKPKGVVDKMKAKLPWNKKKGGN